MRTLSAWQIAFLGIGPYVCAIRQTMRSSAMVSDAIELCGTSDNFLQKQVAPIITTARGQKYAEGYALPKLRIYICAHGSPHLGFSFTPELKPLTQEQVSDYFNTLEKLFPGKDLFVWVLDAGGNLVAAPAWDEGVEKKHGDLTPGATPFQRPNAAPGFEKRTSGQYRGKARLGGEFVLVADGGKPHWQINQKSGYALQRLPISTRDQLGSPVSNMPRNPTQLLEKTTSMDTLQRMSCYMNTLGIASHVHSHEICVFADQSCRPETETPLCCDGVTPSECGETVWPSFRMHTPVWLRIWSAECPVSHEVLGERVTELDAVLRRWGASGSSKDEESRALADRKIVGKHFAWLQKSGCFDEVVLDRPDCDMAGLFARMSECKIELKVNLEKLPMPDALRAASACWTDGESQPTEVRKCWVPTGS